MSFDGILDRMPHKGPMRLIEQIISANDTDIHCVACSHTADDYPLRIDGALYAAALVELGAQAAAAHASLHAIKGNHTGLLIGLQNVEFASSEVTETIDPIDIFAHQLHFDSNGALYGFEVISGTTTHIAGRAALKMQGEPQ